MYIKVAGDGDGGGKEGFFHAGPTPSEESRGPTGDVNPPPWLAQDGVPGRGGVEAWFSRSAWVCIPPCFRALLSPSALDPGVGAVPMI